MSGLKPEHLLEHCCPGGLNLILNYTGKAGQLSAVTWRAMEGESLSCLCTVPYWVSSAWTLPEPHRCPEVIWYTTSVGHEGHAVIFLPCLPRHTGRWHLQDTDVCTHVGPWQTWGLGARTLWVGDRDLRGLHDWDLWIWSLSRVSVNLGASWAWITCCFPLGSVRPSAAQRCWAQLSARWGLAP